MSNRNRDFWFVLALFGFFLATPEGRAQTQDYRSSPSSQLTVKQPFQFVRALHTAIAVKGFKETLTLKEALGWLMEEMAKKDIELPIFVDLEAFKEEEMMDVYDVPVKILPCRQK